MGSSMNQRPVKEGAGYVASAAYPAHLLTISFDDPKAQGG
jgi:hypothetical protein